MLADNAEMARGIYGPWTDLDLDAQGRFVGTVNVPTASTRSAYQAIRVPIVVVRGGDGPTVLLTAGTHGDEYEGQIALRRLAREIEPEWLAGGLVIMPALNLPAVAAAARLSPIDDGNLNSAYPGRIDGGPTSQIAYFVETELLPRAAAWIDLHSGGSSLEYLPMAAMHRSDNLELDSSARAALCAFGAPVSVEFGLQHEYSSSSAAQRHGLVYLYGEFGGGGTLSRAGLEIVDAGLIRALRHFGVSHEGRGSVAPPPSAIAFYETVAGIDYAATRKCFAFAPADGLFEPLRRLGETVEEGGVLGLLYDVHRIAAAPTEILAPMPGLLIAKRHPLMTESGDCLWQVATPLEDPQ